MPRTRAPRGAGATARSEGGADVARFSLITFDLDDTLWDVRPVLEHAEIEVSDWMRVHCPRVLERFDRGSLMRMRMDLLRERPDLRHRISDLRIEAMRRACRDSGMDEADALRTARAAFAIFIAARHAVEPFAAVDETLELLARDYVLGALTNGNADVFRVPLGRHFRFAYSAEQLDSSKPDPLHFESALRHAGVAPGASLHIGDHREQDIGAARRLGIRTIWFDREGKGWSEGEPPDARFSDYRELPRIIAELEKAAFAA